MELRGATASHVGNVRENNQDRVHFGGFTGVVADGMGGHQGGEMAASIAIAEFIDVTDPIAPGGLVELVEEANRAVFEKAADPDLRGMGTTLVALTLRPSEEKVCVVNVGDSRAYRLRGDEFRQLTLDHSLVEDLVRQNRLTPSEALTHPQRNILTRALGIASEVEVDRFLELAHLGDRFLLCSDGLFNEVVEEDMVAILRECEEPNDAADRLVTAALGAAGRDNVTVAVIDIVPEGEGGDVSSEAAETLLVPVVGSNDGRGAGRRRRGTAPEDHDGQAEVAFGQTAVGVAEADAFAERSDGGGPGFDVTPRGFDPDVTATNGLHTEPDSADHHLEDAPEVDLDGDSDLELEPDEDADSASDTSQLSVDEADRRPRRRGRKAVFALIVLGGLAVGGYFAVNQWVSSQYYVDVSGDQVIVFRGRADGFLWTDPSQELVPESGSEFDRLTNDAQNQVRERRTFSNPSEAEAFIADLEREPVVTDETLADAVDDAAGTAAAEELEDVADVIDPATDSEGSEAPGTPTTATAN